MFSKNTLQNRFVYHPKITMKTYKRVSSIQKYLSIEKKQKRKIGFTPTMGALHAGHMSLIKKSNEENEISVASVFVNPTQFNDKKDLKKYPRDLNKDANLLSKNGCDYLFAPTVTQVYPKSGIPKIKLDLSNFTNTMEGPNRPGHFEGVVEVVHRLLDIIKPDNLYMGQKDFQQFTIIGHMIRTLKMPTKLRVCPIIREDDGLAMSSRNVRLSKAIRPKCAILYKALSESKENLKKKSIAKLESTATKMLSIKDFDPEYFKIVDGYTLQEVRDPKKHKLIVACTAVWAKDVRLIDNMVLKGEKHIR